MQSSEDLPKSLNIITFNCWGLKFISKLRHERLSEIGIRLAVAEPQPHIVGLQECWTQEDYACIRKHTKRILPFGKFYHSGIFGGGLAILSKWPIEESSMVRYPLNGRPTAFFRGDWFVGKGVASARIRLGPGVKDVAEVFCTHLHAPYEQEPNDSYICHRTAQAWEIAKILRGAAERGHLAIGLGDFNMIPLSLAHQLITTHAPVEDVWRVLYPESSLGAAEDSVEKARGRSVPSARFNITQNGVTCDSIMNTWRWSPEHQKRLLRGENVSVDDKSLDPKAKRLDYIFTSSGTMQDMSWKVANVSVGLSQRHASLGCSLSDHFSVEATMIRTESERERNATRESNFLPIATYDEILQMISTYMTREQRQRRLRLAHFVGSVFVSIGCHIGIWWSKRNFVSFLLLLLSTLGLGAGVIDGMIGGLFIGSEIRALKEFRWEMEAVRGAAERFDTAKEA